LIKPPDTPSCWDGTTTGFLDEKTGTHEALRILTTMMTVKPSVKRASHRLNKVTPGMTASMFFATEVSDGLDLNLNGIPYLASIKPVTRIVQICGTRLPCSTTNRSPFHSVVVLRFDKKSNIEVL